MLMGKKELSHEHNHNHEHNHSHEHNHEHKHGVDHIHSHRNLIGFDEHGVPTITLKSEIVVPENAEELLKKYGGK